MTHAQKARELFLSGANCAQSILGAFADVIPLPPELALRISAPFGGGLARQRSLCGAVSGISMVLGLLYASTQIESPEAKAGIYAREQALCKPFLEKFGHLECRALLASRLAVISTTPVPDARTKEYYQKRPCLALIEAAAEILDDYISTHPIP